MVLRGIGVQVAAWPGISCNVAAPTQGSIHPTRTRHNQASAAKEKKKKMTAGCHDNREAAPAWDKGWQVPFVWLRERE